MCNDCKPGDNHPRFAGDSRIFVESVPKDVKPDYLAEALIGEFRIMKKST